MSKEKRINKRLLAYWNSLKEPGNDVPKKAALNPEDIADVWDNCFILDARTGKYSFLGKNIMAICEGQSLLVKDLYSNLLCPVSSTIPSIIKEVAQTRQPISQESQYINPYNATIKYRRCFLPMADKSEKVRYVLGAMRWLS